jgi:N-dimethylarginine dimethylaminohydrolase
MAWTTTQGMSEAGRMTQVVVKDPRAAFVAPERIASEWRALNFTHPPNLSRAIEEYDQFLMTLDRAGADIRALPPGIGVGLDSIYVRDASIAAPGGMILANMSKPQRGGEPAAQDQAFLAWDIPVVGAIRDPGRLEGGDVVWLGPRTVAVGRGYRTNDHGVAQFRKLLGDAIDDVIEVPLPHWRGERDVFHLMSLLSPVSRDLAVVYEPLLPVPFRERLLDLGWRFIGVPDEEFESMGANVLALSPGVAVVLAGNPRTRANLEAAGVETLVYSGVEISLKGGGGPTCLTRPIQRAPL